jgi:hypothetical protein
MLPAFLTRRPTDARPGADLCELWNLLDSSRSFILSSLFVFFLEFQMIDGALPGAVLVFPSWPTSQTFEAGRLRIDEPRHPSLLPFAW